MLYTSIADSALRAQHLNRFPLFLYQNICCDVVLLPEGAQNQLIKTPVTFWWMGVFGLIEGRFSKSFKKTPRDIYFCLKYKFCDGMYENSTLRFYVHYTIKICVIINLSKSIITSSKMVMAGGGEFLWWKLSNFTCTFYFSITVHKRRKVFTSLLASCKMA